MHMENNDNKKEKNEIKGIVVKGYLRPDGSYYTTVPKKIVELFKLKGEELFLIKAKLDKKELKVRIIDLPEE